MPTIKAQPDWLRAPALATNSRIGVDREKNIIYGRVAALAGPFKSEGRGEFDLDSLKSIVQLTKRNEPRGTRARWTHPGLSSDGLGTFLGRDHNFRLDKAIHVNEDTGKQIEVDAVRSDLHFDPTAFKTPEKGDLATYVMDLAANDPDAFSSSLVLKVDEEYRRKKDGTLETGEDGQPLPPLWRPKSILALDVVDTGDAVDSFLSAGLSIDGLPDEIVWRAQQLLDKQFPGADRQTIEARAQAWLTRYLDQRFGATTQAVSVPMPTPILDRFRDRLERLSLTKAKVKA